MVAAVMARNRHYCSGSVAHEYVVAGPNRNRLFGEGMLHVASREHPADALGVCLAFALASPRRSLAVCIDVGLLTGARPMREHGVLRSNDHEGGPKNGVGAGGEYFEHVGSAGCVRSACNWLLAASCFAKATEYLECNSCSLASTDPMALGFFDAVAPIELVEAVEQSLGKGTDAHGPLQHGLLHHGVSAALA